MRTVGMDSSVDIATRCGLDGPGIEFLSGDKFSASFRVVRRTPHNLLYYEYRVIPGVITAGAWRYPPIPL